MIKPEREALAQVRKILEEEIRDFYVSRASRLGNLTEWNIEDLLAFDFILELWCADAIIRFTRIEENPDWGKVCNWARRTAAQLSLDELAKIYLKTRDGKSLFCLIGIYIDREATFGEILRRIESLNFGEKFIGYLGAEPGEESLERTNDLLKQVRSGIGGWLKKMKIGIIDNPEKGLLLKALETPLAIERKHEESEQEEKKEKWPIEQLEDVRNGALLTISRQYEKLKKEITLKNWRDIPHSIIHVFRSVDPEWDRAARRIFEISINEFLREFVPIIEGKSEKIPLKVHDSYIDKYRSDLDIEEVEDERLELDENQEEKLTAWGVTKKREITLFKSNSKDGRKEEIRLDEIKIDEYYWSHRSRFSNQPQLTEIEAVEKHHDEPKEEKIIKEKLLKLLRGAKKKESLLKAFTVMIFEEKTELEAAQLYGISTKSIQNHLPKVISILPRRFKLSPKK